MQIIYETTNHLFKSWGITPYRYIGSDQHNKPNYFGSSKLLKNDINDFGKEFFEKKILYSFENVSNVELREFESKLLISLDCAKDKTYYNRTNTSHKGYIETEEEKIIRMKKTQDKFRIWFDTTPEAERKKYNVLKNYSLLNLKGKTYEEIYGKEKSEEIKEKIRDKTRGRNNGASKYNTFTENDRLIIKNLYRTGLYHKKDLMDMFKVSLRTISDYTKGISRYENEKFINIIENGIKTIVYK